MSLTYGTGELGSTCRSNEQVNTTWHCLETRAFQRMQSRNVGYLWPRFVPSRVGTWILAFCICTLLSPKWITTYCLMGFYIWWEVLVLQTLAGVFLQKVLDWWTCLSADLRSRSTISFFLHIFQMLVGIWTRYFLGRLSDKKEIHTSDQHKQLPAHLNNLNRKQTELGRISNLEHEANSYAQITHAKKQV